MDYDAYVNNGETEQSEYKADNEETLNEPEKQKDEKPGKEKRKSSLAKKIVTAVLAVAVAILVVISYFPSVVAGIALKDAANGLMNRGEIKPFLKTAAGGSVEASLGDIKYVDEDGEEEEIFEGSVSGKIYFSKDALMLSNVKAEVGDFKIDGEAYISRDLIYVREDEILEDAYGVNMDTLADDLANSIFAPGSGSEYELDEEIYDIITDVLENLESNPDLEKDATKLVKTVVKDVIKIVLDNAEVTDHNTTIKTGGERKNVRVITLTIDGAAMAGIVEDLYNYLCESKDIPAFLEKYEDTIIPLLSDLYDEDEYDSLTDMYDKLLEEYEETIEELCDTLSESEESFSLELATPRLQTKLLKIDFLVGKDSVFSLDFGAKGAKKTDVIEATIGDYITATYKVKENSSSAIIAECVIDPGFDNDTVYTLSIDINKAREKYTIEFDQAYVTDTYYNGSRYDTDVSDKYVIKGSYTTKGDTTTITVDEFKNVYVRDCEIDDKDSESTDTYKLNASLTMDTGDKMPKPMKDFKTIADLTDKKIEKIIEKISEIF